jgi:NAD(P)-dependent dehydrogenase (short-subunit alcohol dehydrogenase family)
MLEKIPLGRFAGECHRLTRSLALARAVAAAQCVGVGAPQEDAHSRLPPPRMVAEVQDVVDPILFLLSDRSLMINGAMVPIEGGFLCG